MKIRNNLSKQPVSLKSLTEKKSLSLEKNGANQLSSFKKRIYNISIRRVGEDMVRICEQLWIQLATMGSFGKSILGRKKRGSILADETSYFSRLLQESCRCPILFFSSKQQSPKTQ